MKEKTVVVIIFLGLFLSLLGIGGASYSLYKSSPRGRTIGAVANWSFSVNGSKDTFAIDSVANAKNTYDGKIAPGSYGSFDIKLDASSTDMDVKYKITFNNLKGKPTNLKFYLDSNYLSEIDLTTVEIDGIINYNDNMVKTVTIYWNWDYEGYDDVYDSVISFDINVVGSQVI